MPKDQTDIPMVYNATSSGPNDAVYAPWFALPTVELHLRAVDVNTYMGDYNIGKMFLNFVLDVNIREYAGADFSELLKEEAGGRKLWERWERLLMGYCPSPYLTTREMKKVEARTKGNRHYQDNVFRWEKIVLNLPGKTDYNPSKPWVYKVRTDGVIAGNLFSYIDDYQNTGPSKQECWNGGHRTGCSFTFHGIQDVARKRREPSQEPGAWADTIIHMHNRRVMMLASQMKWEKTKAWISWLEGELNDGDDINFKCLEKCQGFLIYVSRTYRPFIPYLKVFIKQLMGGGIIAIRRGGS